MKYRRFNQQGITQPVIIIGIVIAIAIIGGIVAFVMMRGGDTTPSSSTNTANEVGNASNPTFAPMSTAGISYEAKINGTAGDSTIAATIEYDGKGNSHYIGTAPEPSETYQFGNEYIMCDDAHCMSIPTTNQPAGSGEATYSDADIESWNNTAVYKGKQDCPSGTCDTWQITKDGHTGTLFIASDGRISRSTWISSESSMTIDFEYKAITITRPENIQAMPGMQ